VTTPVHLHGGPDQLHAVMIVLVRGVDDSSALPDPVNMTLILQHFFTARRSLDLQFKSKKAVQAMFG